ncbi:hypothetical protein D3C77_231200 [compost metagenome]
MRLHLPHPACLYPVALADGHQRPGNSQQLDNGQVLAGLRHHPVISGDHQDHQVDSLGPGEHVVDKSLVSRYVDEAGQRRPRLQAGVAVTEIDGHAPFTLFPALIAGLAGQGFEQ